MANVLASEIIENEFEHQYRSYVHFRILLGDLGTALYFQFWVK